MKLKEFFYLLGLRPGPRTYGHEVRDFDLPAEGRVRYAQWLHPRETAKQMRQEDVDALRTFLRPGDVAIDIGAHTGDTTIPMALAVGPTGCVIALEPNHYVYPVLERNAALNPEKTRIIPLRIAATPTDGVVRFEYSDAGFCNGGRHEGVNKWMHGHAFELEVEGRNLEALLRRDYAELIPRIRLIKVDAEGYDHQVLLSLAGLIREVRPFLKAEVFRRTSAAQRATFLAFLHELGYQVHRAEGEALPANAPLGEGDLLRWPHFDIFAVPQAAPQGAH